MSRKRPRDDVAVASGTTDGDEQRAKGRRQAAAGTTKRESMIFQAREEVERWSKWLLENVAEGDALADKFWHASKPACSRKNHTTKQNCQDNPNCVWGLGEHKNGVWAKSPASLAAIERPAETLREPLDPKTAAEATPGAAVVRGATPVGLRNLGATCYVNSILQALFLNPEFRTGMFACGYPAPEVLSPSEVGDDATTVQRASDESTDGSGPSTAVAIDVEEEEVEGVSAAAARQVRHDAKQGVLCSQLQWLFACLQDSVLASYTPSEMVKSMGLSTAYQQDVGEFYKLLLSSLERELGEAPSQSVRNLVQDLHQGKFRHVTTCQGCYRESEMSATELPFYELQLQPKDGGSLQQSLNDYLAEEHLDGDNKYFCSHCQNKQNAVRKNELLKLPSSLWFQLTRYHYDWNTGTKKKLRSRFSFPNVIDMAPFVGKGAQNTLGEQTYELVGVLVHTGSSANAGHYTAHLRSHEKQWWKFDDETVTKLKPSELGEEPEATAETAASKAKGKAKGKAKSKAKSKMTTTAQVKAVPEGKVKSQATAAGKVKGTTDASSSVTDHADMTTSDADTTPATASRTLDESAEIDDNGVRTSTNAYMLIYRRRDGEAIAQPECEEELRKRVQRENMRALSRIEDFEARCLKEKQRIEKTKQAIQEVLSMMEDDPADSVKPHRWIPTDYLQSFVTGKADLGKIDTTAILCGGQHNTGVPAQPKLRPAPSAKRISVAAWSKIVSLKGLDGPEVAEDSRCTLCALDFASDRHAELQRIEADFTGLELLDGSGRATDDGIGNVYMSRPWIKRWKARSKTKSFASLRKDPWELLLARRKKPQDREALQKAGLEHKKELWNLNLDLQCEHGELVPDTSLWQEVTPDVWRFFVEQRKHANGENSQLAEYTDPPKFPTTQSGCNKCNADHLERVRNAESVKKEADEQRKDEHLSMVFGFNACTPSSMYQHYMGQKENPLYVISTVWLNKWRQYIAPGKSKVGAPRIAPGPIDNSPLLCPHEKLKYNPMIEYKKYNFYHEHFTLLDRYQWHKLYGRYGGGPSIKWWQETPFLQGLKPKEPERQQTKRAVVVWSKEEDEYVITLQKTVGEQKWVKKATLFNEKFASKPRTGNQIGDRWRKVLKDRATSPHKKRKLEVVTDSAEMPLIETEVATPRQSAVSMKQNQDSYGPGANLTDDETDAGSGTTMVELVDDGLPNAEVCDDCNKAREEEELRKQLHFTDKILYVKHVARPPESSCEDDNRASDTNDGRRKSRRSRAGKAFQTYTVVMSSVETLSDLKLKVIQQAAGDMFPNQMQLYNCKRKIDSDSDNIPLHALEIQKGATLEMVLNDEIVGDYGDLFGAADDDHAEQGFAGTALY